jgi:hypothetical protein
MSDEPENPPAFPRPGFDQPAGLQDGMTLRDYFAAAALPAIITAVAAKDHTPAVNLEGATVEERIAYDAYKVADAMLRVRFNG